MRSNAIADTFKEMIYSGMEYFGRYYSTYRAFVYDNSDPNNLNRLQLIIPETTGNQPYKYWAFPKNNFSGEDYGIQVLPKKGDLVWVEFERGNAKLPIWSHGYYGIGEKPTGEEWDDTNSYWFKSPKGNWVMINDTKEFIHASLKGGEKYIKIHKDKVTVKFQETEINLDDLIELKTKNESMYKLMDDLFSLMEKMTFTNSGGTTYPMNELSEMIQIHSRLPKLFK